MGKISCSERAADLPKERSKTSVRDVLRYPPSQADMRDIQGGRETQPRVWGVKPDISSPFGHQVDVQPHHSRMETTGLGYRLSV